MLLLRSLLFTKLMFASVPPYALAAMVAALVSRGGAYRVARAWVDLTFFLLRVICRIDYTVEGEENIPSDNGVALWKHQSTWETFAQLRIFPRQCWVLKRELLRVPFFGWGLRTLDPIAIDRRAGRAAVEQVLEQGRERLARGLWVMVFPEGTRVAPGTTRRYGLSGILLAQQTGRPLVPVAHNAGDVWPRRGWIKRPGTVRVVIGEPIATAGRDPKQIAAEAQAWIEGQMARISDAYRRRPATAPSQPAAEGR